MGMSTLPSFIAGARVEPDERGVRIRSLDEQHELVVAETSAVQLRRALRYGDECQPRVAETPLRERIAAARLVCREYLRHADDACFGLAHFRGLVARDTRWMCDVNVRWAERFEQLLEVMTGGMEREVSDGARRDGTLSFRSRGKACLFSSSTMDGPAAVVAVCHAMLSGTHLILRPSFRDAATHLAFEVLREHGLAHYAQLVRYRSDAQQAPQLNRLLLGNVEQAIVFSASETYRELIDAVAAPGSPEWDALHARTHRYGTGLPLAIVTANADLERAAEDIVEGARLGGGRFCLSTGPVIVERSCQARLRELMIACAARLRRGHALDEATDLSSHERANGDAIRSALAGFGGTVAWGEIRAADMDVVVLSDVPQSSPALHRELPGPVLSLIPAEGLAEYAAIATAALRKNHRSAWTAAVLFGVTEECQTLERTIPSFRYLRGGVVARVKLVLPHQGSYFALDLMRRVSME